MAERKTPGFYTSGTEDSFRTLSQIRRGDEPVVATPYEPPSFSNMTDLYTRRQEERQRLLPIPDRISIDFKTQDPVYIALIGDIHAGGGYVDYDRVHREVSYLKDVDEAHVMFITSYENIFL